MSASSQSSLPRAVTERIYISNSGSGQALQKKIKDYQVRYEYLMLKTYAPSGVIMTPRNLRCWDGAIFIRSGGYAKGVFKFRMDIPEEYPDCRPNVFFETQIWHPLIDLETGLLNLGPRFVTWRPRKDFIFCILSYMKQIFYDKTHLRDNRFILNEEAYQQYTRQPSQFWLKVKECIASSNQCKKLYKPAKNLGQILAFERGHPQSRRISLEASALAKKDLPEEEKVISMIKMVKTMYLN